MPSASKEYNHRYGCGKRGYALSAIRYDVRHPLRQWKKGVGHLVQKDKNKKNEISEIFFCGVASDYTEI